MTFRPDIPATVADGPILDEVLFEIAAYGTFVKVSAIDPITNTEVSVIGAPSLSPHDLKMHALRKLRRALTSDADDVAKGGPRPGLWA